MITPMHGTVVSCVCVIRILKKEDKYTNEIGVFKKKCEGGVYGTN